MKTPGFITSHPWLVVTSAARAGELCNTLGEARVGALLSIADPFDGKRPRRHVFERLGENAIRLDFDDVESAVPVLGDGEAVVVPDAQHVDRILRFGRRVRVAGVDGRILVHCFAGRSRSTAAAFILLCAEHGPGREADAMRELLTACERAPLPNLLMCRIADELLERGGALLRVAQQQNDAPEDAECEGNKPVTGTALLAAVRRGDL